MQVASKGGGRHTQSMKRIAESDGQDRQRRQGGFARFRAPPPERDFASVAPFDEPRKAV